jgi:hypothetical protein
MDKLILDGPEGHTRKIKIQTRRASKNQIQVRAELKDSRPTGRLFFKPKALIHHMVVRLTINTQLIIEKAEFATLKGPYLECVNHAVSPDKLVGLSLQKGFTKNVMDLYGGVNGCSHILTLLTNLAPAVRQGLVFTVVFPEEEKSMTPDSIVPTVQKMGKFIEDTCQVWRTDSEVQKDLKQGRLRDLPKRLYPNFWRKNKGLFK